MSEYERLALDIAAVLGNEANGMPCATIAKRLRRRNADVLAVLQTDARFDRRGRTRGTRWRLQALSDVTGRNGKESSGRAGLGSRLDTRERLEARDGVDDHQLDVYDVLALADDGRDGMRA